MVGSWTACGASPRSGGARSGRVERAFEFVQRLPHLSEEVPVLPDDLIEIVLAYEEELVGHADPARDELERVQRLDVVRVQYAHFQRAVLERQRHEAVVAR